MRINTDQRIVKKLKLLYPKVYAEMAIEPYLVNFDEISTVINYLQDNKFNSVPYWLLPRFDRKDFEEKLTILVIQLFDPDWLNYDLFILRKQLRQRFVEIFELSPSATSERLKQFKGFYEVDPEFRNTSRRNYFEFIKWYERTDR